MAEPSTPGPDREQLLHELGNAVRANQRATDHVDEAAAQVLRINRTDAKFLDLLDQHGRMSAGALARESGLTTGAVTGALDRLEDAGYVRRVNDPDDRRRVLAEATELTRQLSWELFGPMAQAAREWLAGYTDEQLALVIDFLKLGQEMQERHAANLRERLKRKSAEQD